MRLLEGRSNRLKKYGLLVIYAGSTDEPLWVSAAGVGVTIDKGGEGTFKKQMEIVVLEERKFCCFLNPSAYEIFDFV